MPMTNVKPMVDHKEEDLVGVVVGDVVALEMPNGVWHLAYCTAEKEGAALEVRLCGWNVPTKVKELGGLVWAIGGAQSKAAASLAEELTPLANKWVDRDLLKDTLLQRAKDLLVGRDALAKASVTEQLG